MSTGSCIITIESSEYIGIYPDWAGIQVVLQAIPASPLQTFYLHIVKATARGIGQSPNLKAAAPSAPSPQGHSTRSGGGVSP